MIKIDEKKIKPVNQEAFKNENFLHHEEYTEVVCRYMMIDGSSASKINKKLAQVSSHSPDTYYKGLGAPLDDVAKCFAGETVEISGKEYPMYTIVKNLMAGIYTGERGKADHYFGNRVIVFSWYRMETSGKYEVNTYLS